MGNRQHRDRPNSSALDQAADRAMAAYESVANSMGVTVSSVLVIGVGQDGKANISLSCDGATDPDDVVLTGARAYFEAKGKTLGVFDRFPAR